MKNSKQVVAFDGEGIDSRYTLLAASDGQSIDDRHGLRPLDCLKFLTRPDYHKTLNLWYSFGYDVNMMLRGVGSVDFWRGTQAIRYGAYRVTYYPKKILKIETRGKRFVHYDIFGFFQTSFKNAIGKWLGVVDPLINAGKAARGDFSHWSQKRIADYNTRELKYLAQLGEKLIAIFTTLDIPLKMKSWHGAGAGANAVLALTGLQSELNGDPRVEELAQEAYFGGRIETLWRGDFENVYHADIRSAYPAAMCELSDLSNTVWKSAKTIGGGLGVYRIKFDSPPAPFGPFPVRQTSGAICYPLRGQGTYWSPEIQAAQSQGVKIKVLKGLAAVETSPSKLAGLVTTLYDLRATYRANGDGREKAVKLILNSLYGKLAQKERGAYHSIALAGLVTSITRAKLYSSGCQRPGAIIAFSTDGIYAREPLELPLGTALGLWDIETIDRASFLMNGVYTLTRDGRTEYKTRGYDTDQWTFDQVVYDLKMRGTATTRERRFVTNLISLHSPNAYPDPCAWVEVVKTLSLDRDVKRNWPGRFDGSPQWSTPKIWDSPSKPYSPTFHETLEDLMIRPE